MRVRLRHQELAKALTRKRLSQNAWAQRIGVSRGHLSNLLSGKRPFPSARTQRKLLEALDLSFGDLFVIEREEPAPEPSLGRLLDWQLFGLRLRLDRARFRTPSGRLGAGLTDSLLMELQLALRNLARSPGYTTVGVLSLALGIGASTAAFAVVSSSLLAPPPHPEPERLFTMEEHGEELGANWIALGDLLEWRSQSDSFEAIAIYDVWRPFQNDVTPPRRLEGFRVSSDFFEVFGVHPQLGRALISGEDRLGSERVVLISDRLWRTRFSGSDSIQARSIRLNGERHTIIGVLPAGFGYADLHPDVIAPLPLDQPNRLQRFFPVGRLKDGASVDAATRELTRIHRAVTQTPWDGPINITLESVASSWSQRRAREAPRLLLLMGSVAAVLLIGCANLANLAVGRALSRRPEVAIRASLGASRLNQLLTGGLEALLLGVGGGLLALIVAYWSLDLIIAWIPFELTAAVIHLGFTAFAFGALVSVGIGVLCAVSVALAGGRLDLAPLLASGGPAQPRHRRRYLSRAFVVAELAVSLTLLAGAALLINSFIKVTGINPGFEYHNVTVVEIPLSQERYTEAENLPPPEPSPFWMGSPTRTVRPRADRFMTRLLEEARQLPGVRGAEVTATLGGMATYNPWGVEPHPVVRWGASFLPVTPGLLDLLKIPVLKGRGFSAGDTEESTPVAIVSETVARHWWADTDPIGQRLKMRSENEWREVVGVVADKRSFRNFKTGAHSIYIPFDQAARSSTGKLYRLEVALLLKTDGVGPRELEVRQLVEKLDPDQPILRLSTFEDLFHAQIAEERFFTILLAILAAVALLLGVTGVYGVMNFAVASRTFEIGVRMALGAARREVIRLVLMRAILTMLLGTAFGLGGAFYLSTSLEGLLFEVEPLDAWSFSIAVVLLLIAAFAASYVPARRAARIDPLEALRHN